MAENEYRRLACPGCAAVFAPIKKAQYACGKACSRKVREGRGAVRAALQERGCQVCGCGFMPIQRNAVYCSRRCKTKAWRAANPARWSELRKVEAARQAAKNKPTLCAYFAGYCGSCGDAWGARRQWAKCGACIRKDMALAARIAHRASAEAKHKAAGRVVSCSGCQTEFCPIYGANRGCRPYCVPCADAAKRAAKVRERKRSGGTARQRAKRMGAYCERFDPIKVLERDRWRCQLCRRKTPMELRGTCAPNAPELDHIVALALGGPHTMANCQCLCRACNLAKGATALGQLHLALT